MARPPAPSERSLNSSTTPHIWARWDRGSDRVGDAGRPAAYSRSPSVHVHRAIGTSDLRMFPGVGSLKHQLARCRGAACASDFTTRGIHPSVLKDTHDHEAPDGAGRQAGRRGSSGHPQPRRLRLRPDVGLRHRRAGRQRQRVHRERLRPRLPRGQAVRRGLERPGQRHHRGDRQLQRRVRRQGHHRVQPDRLRRRHQVVLQRPGRLRRFRLGAEDRGERRRRRGRQGRGALRRQPGLEPADGRRARSPSPTTSTASTPWC